MRGMWLLPVLKFFTGIVFLVVSTLALLGLIALAGAAFGLGLKWAGL